MRAHRNNPAVLTITLLVLLVAMSGCGIKTAIRAPESMLKENPMTKIVLLSAGKINWPSVGGKFCLQQSGSLAATEAFTRLAKDELTTMGYDVVMAEPVGVGFQCRDWRVMPEKKDDGETKPEDIKVITDDTPVMISPKFQNQEPFSQAVVKLSDDFERALQKGQSDEFEPEKHLVAVIGETTGADTICLTRVSGAKYTSARKITSAILGGSASDTLAASILFISTKTGEVLWQHWSFSFDDPMEPTPSFFKTIFKYLPHKGQPFDNALCSAGEKSGFVYCK